MTLRVIRVFADYYELLLFLIQMGHKIGHNFFTEDPRQLQEAAIESLGFIA